MRNLHPCRLGAVCLAFTVTLPLAAQFEADAVVQYTAERVLLGFIPQAMNNRGWIVGGTGEYGYPMRYRPGVGTEQISNIRGRLYDINDAGTAVGFLSLDGRDRAIMRPAGAPWKRLGSLGGDRSRALAINESGQIVGSSRTSLGLVRPFIYTEAEGMKLLFDQAATANGINSAGQVSATVNGTRGMLWDPVEGLIDITSRAGLDSDFTPVGVSDDGVVAGEYRNRIATFSLINGIRIIGEHYYNLTPRAVNRRGWMVATMAHTEGSSLDLQPVLYVYGQGVRLISSLLTAPLASPLNYVYDINDRDEILVRTRDSRYYLLKRVRE